jgi:hypothetical protein
MRLQLLVTAAGFCDRQRFSNGLFVFPKKRHVMSKPRRVDPHAEIPQDCRLCRLESMAVLV